jgi:hypothetical protein
VDRFGALNQQCPDSGNRVRHRQYVRKNPVRFLEWWLSDKRRYRNIIRRAGPKIHAGFFEQMLNLAIEKNGKEKQQ